MGNLFWFVFMGSLALNAYWLIPPIGDWTEKRVILLRGHWKIKRMKHAGEILGPTNYKGNLSLSIKEGLDMQMLTTGEDVTETINRALKLFIDLEAERRAGTAFWAERNSNDHLEELKWR